MIALALAALLLGAGAAPARAAKPAAKPAAKATPKRTPAPAPTPVRAASPTPAPSAAPTPAAAGPGTIAVTVVEAAGKIAYVKPGEKAGLVTGQSVVFGSKSYQVVDVTAEAASLAIEGDPLAVGAIGQASITHATGPAAIARPKPGANAVPAAWNPPVLPSTTQAPRRVPLSAAASRARGPWSAVVSARAAALSPTTPSSSPTGSPLGPAYTGELQARGWARFGANSPFALDADASLLGWNGHGIEPLDAENRPNARVRELALRAGDHEDPWGAAGRLRRAAWMLGTLDGARARAPLGNFSLGAFGGFLPDPLSGAPSSEASRFGVELSWRASDAAWRPEVVVVAHGSRFKGETDERRVTASTSAFGKYAGGFAYAEVSAFDKTNPWNADPLELSAAGADASVRAGPLRLRARADMRSPERSLWLQSHLPLSWLCMPDPRAPGTPEPCSTARNRRWLGAADAELAVKWLALDAGVTTTSWGPFSTTSQEIEGFGDVRTFGLPHDLRISAGGHVAQGALVDHAGGYLGVGRLFLDDRLDLSLTFRPNSYTYRAIPGAYSSNRVEGALNYAARPSLDVGLMVDATTGTDSKSTFVLFTTTWHAL